MYAAEVKGRHEDWKEGGTVFDKAAVVFLGSENSKMGSNRCGRGSQWRSSLNELAPGGVWNFLSRTGAKIQEPSRTLDLLEVDVRIVFAVLLGGEDCRRWLEGICCRFPNASVIVSGDVPSIQHLTTVSRAATNWGSGLAVTLGQEPPKFYLPNSSEVFSFTSDELSEWKAVGNLIEIKGNRFSPEDTKFSVLEDAPIALVRNQVTILNGSPFSALQGFLQGALDVASWGQWYSRFHWLDEYCLFVRDVVSSVARLKSWEFCHIDPVRVLSLQHDLDDSDDDQFLRWERDEGIPATHAILLDGNSKYWVDKLRTSTLQVAGFHVNTGEVPTVLDRVVNRAKRSVIPPKPDRNQIAGKGLEKQLKRARRLGISVSTLHRHQSFLFYPEWIESLHRASLDPTIRGSSSYFRGTVIDRSLGNGVVKGFSVDHPGVITPYWYPFRLWHSGERVLVKPWETTALMEPDKELAEHVFDGCERLGLPAVVPVTFHPAHTKHSRIIVGGNFAEARSLVFSARQRGWSLKTLSQCFDLAESGAVLPRNE